MANKNVVECGSFALFAKECQYDDQRVEHNRSKDDYQLTDGVDVVFFKKQQVAVKKLAGIGNQMRSQTIIGTVRRV